MKAVGCSPAPTASVEPTSFLVTGARVESFVSGVPIVVAAADSLHYRLATQKPFELYAPGASGAASGIELVVPPAGLRLLLPHQLQTMADFILPDTVPDLRLTAGILERRSDASGIAFRKDLVIRWGNWFLRADELTLTADDSGMMTWIQARGAVFFHGEKITGRAGELSYDSRNSIIQLVGDVEFAKDSEIWQGKNLEWNTGSGRVICIDCRQSIAPSQVERP